TFTDGVFFVALAPINEPDLVISVIAQALGTKEVAGSTLIEVLKRYLREKQMLLLLDNFEQLLPAAPLVTELLSACHQLKVLVASRAPLRLSCEHEFPVTPLALPDLAQCRSAEALSQNEAMQLFIQRARSVKPDFAIDETNARSVAEICIRLDGLPLAIELAAARVKLLSPQAILARLENRLELLIGGPRDLPARQQTMRDTIAWSYDLLDEDGKRLFRRLGVFAGGLTLEAADAVCNTAGEPRVDILESLASLVDKSLLDQKEQADGEPRFTMLETFKEYGLAQLEAGRETSNVRAHHANFFLALIEQAEPMLSGADQAVWLTKLETEHDNLRAALRWAKENGEVEVGSRIAGALGRFWLMHGHYSEGRERLAEFLTSTATSGRTATRAKLLTSAGILAQNQGDYTASRSFFEESLAIWRETGNRDGIAASLTNLGWVAWRQSDYPAARSLSEEGLALHRELGNKQGIAHSLNNLGFVTHHQGDYQAARSFHEESLALRRELGDKRGIAFAQTNLGWALQKQALYEPARALLEEATELFKKLGDKQLLAFSSYRLADVLYDQGNTQRATELLEESVNTCREIGAKYSLAVALRILGNMTCDQGDQHRAATLLDESLNTFREIGDRYGAASALCTLAAISQAKGHDEQALCLFKESLSLRSEIGDKHGIIECLEGLARVALAEHQFVRALQLSEAAAAQRDLVNIQLSASGQKQVERTKTLARSALDDEGFATACEQGRAMTLERAIAFAST
ncbi:MAG: ATP-binding protein, partial [Pyrinomonadaceae bacterium]